MATAIFGCRTCCAPTPFAKSPAWVRLLRERTRSARNAARNSARRCGSCHRECEASSARSPTVTAAHVRQLHRTHRGIGGEAGASRGSAYGSRRNLLPRRQRCEPITVRRWVAKQAHVSATRRWKSITWTTVCEARSRWQGRDEAARSGGSDDELKANSWKPARNAAFADADAAAVAPNVEFDVAKMADSRLGPLLSGNDRRQPTSSPALILPTIVDPDDADERRRICSGAYRRADERDDRQRRSRFGSRHWEANEFAIHISVVDAVRKFAWPDCLFFHVPNGEVRDPRTGAKLKAMGTRRGVADLLFIRPGAPPLFLELKDRVGRQSATRDRISGRSGTCRRTVRGCALARCGAGCAVAARLPGAADCLTMTARTSAPAGPACEQINDHLEAAHQPQKASLISTARGAR